MRISDWSSDVCSSDLPLRIGADIFAHMLVADRDHEAVEAARLQHGAQAGEAPGVDRIGGRVGAGHAAFLVPTPLPILPCGGRRSGAVSMAGFLRLPARNATMFLLHSLLFPRTTTNHTSAKHAHTPDLSSPRPRRPPPPATSPPPR